MILFVYALLVYKQIDVNALWGTAASGGWRPSSAPRSDWPCTVFFNILALKCSVVHIVWVVFEAMLLYATGFIERFVSMQLLQQKLMATCEYVVMVVSTNKEVR